MKKLVMLIALGLAVPMFAARPILKYGDINPITGKVVAPYKGEETVTESVVVSETLPKKPVRVNKGRLAKIAEEEDLFTPEERKLFLEEEQEMVPETRPYFVGPEGQPLPPALPPKSPTSVGKPGRQLTREELKAQKNKVFKKETLMAPSQPQVGGKRAEIHFTGQALEEQKALLKKPSDVRPALIKQKQGDLKEILTDAMKERRPFIEQEEVVTEEWD